MPRSSPSEDDGYALLKYSSPGAAQYSFVEGLRSRRRGAPSEYPVTDRPCQNAKCLPQATDCDSYGRNYFTRRCHPALDAVVFITAGAAQNDEGDVAAGGTGRGW